jgi:antitoxin component HigA of HigAB toxin-antitoxin module
MSLKTKSSAVADSYLKLIMQFPLKPIASHTEYDRAIAVMEKLAVMGEENLDQGQHDYLDGLCEFIMLYDRKHFAFPPDTRTPLQRLKYLLTESETTPAKLQKILGCSQPLVSMILNGSRELSKENIKALAAHFHMQAGYFL